jgi:hypothetical protein
MIESRPRISKKSLLLALGIVAVLTLVLVLAEGFLTLRRKSPQELDGSTISLNNLATNDVPSSKKSSHVDKQTQAGADASATQKQHTMTEAHSDDSRCAPAPDGAEVVMWACRRCTAEETVHIPECSTSLSVEALVVCQGGKATRRAHRTCRDDAAEEKKFIVFEAVNFGFGLASYAIVILRRRKLDYLLAKKIEQQLAGGV